MIPNFHGIIALQEWLVLATLYDTKDTWHRVKLSGATRVRDRLGMELLY
jgi:hypothetical protein